MEQQIEGFAFFLLPPYLSCLTLPGLGLSCCVAVAIFYCYYCCYVLLSIPSPPLLFLLSCSCSCNKKKNWAGLQKILAYSMRWHLNPVAHKPK